LLVIAGESRLILLIAGLVLCDQALQLGHLAWLVEVVDETLAAAAAVGEFEAATLLGLLAAFTPTTSMDRATMAVMIKQIRRQSLVYA